MNVTWMIRGVELWSKWHNPIGVLVKGFGQLKRGTELIPFGKVSVMYVNIQSNGFFSLLLLASKGPFTILLWHTKIF
jgi:hypothetical protein